MQQNLPWISLIINNSHDTPENRSTRVIALKEEPRHRSRPKFRQLSRDVSGEVYDIPEDHQVIFAYETLHGKTVLIGAICFRIADVQLTEPNTEFDSDFYHVIAFLFVKGDFQDQGIGRRLFEKAVTVMLSTTKRPIRVQSAERAVGFFEKMGFVQVKPPSESMCGPRLFRFLYNMEKTVKWTEFSICPWKLRILIPKVNSLFTWLELGKGKCFISKTCGSS